MKISILLTATINPSTTFLLKRRDPIIREGDYLSTLEKLFHSVPYPIVFCENSNYQSEKITSIFKKNDWRPCELIQYSEAPFPVQRGKGYGEMRIIKYAMEHSSILKESDFIIKITGRYCVENLKEIISTLNETIYVMSDYDQNKIYTYSGLFIAKPDFFMHYLFKYLDFIDDSKKRPMEFVLQKAIEEAKKDNRQCVPFAESPIIEGYSGTWDVKIDKKDYNTISFSIAKIKVTVFPKIKYILKKLKII